MNEVRILKGKYQGYIATVTSEHHGLKSLFSSKKWYNVLVHNNGAKLILPSDSIKRKKRKLYN
jgi:hypothetical protein